MNSPRVNVRQFQCNLIKSTAEAFKNYQSVCLQLATGAGKTVISAEFVRLILLKCQANRKGVILFVVHRRELIWQTLNILHMMGVKNTGVIASNIAETPWASVQVASIWTLIKRLDNLHFNPALVVFDEAHHARAKSWETVISHFEKAKILGLTATPGRLDGKGLGKLFDTIVEGPATSWLIEHGYLCGVRVKTTPEDFDISKIGVTAGDYNKADLEKQITQKTIANCVANFVKYAKDRPTLHFAVTIKHSKEIVDSFIAAGFNAEHVDGLTPLIRRKAIFERFDSGETQIISNVDIVTEGFDCPECSCVLLSRRTKSVALLKQMVGRVMRPKKSGSDGLVIDLAGNFSQTSDQPHPEDDVEWTLDDGVIKESVRAKNKAMRVCKNCNYIYPSTKQSCDLCGAEYQTQLIVEVDVNLEELAKARLRKKKTKTHSKRTVFATLIKIFWASVEQGQVNEELLKTSLNGYREELGYNEKVIIIWNNYLKKFRNQQKFRAMSL